MPKEKRLPPVPDYRFKGKAKYYLVSAEVVDDKMFATYRAFSFGPYDEEFITDIIEWKEYEVETF